MMVLAARCVLSGFQTVPRPIILVGLVEIEKQISLERSVKYEKDWDKE